MSHTVYNFTLTLTGATGNTDSPRPYRGRVVAVGFDFTTVPGTTVLTLTTRGTTGGMPYTVLVTPAGNTDTWYFPQQATVLTTTGAAITAWYVDPQVDDFLNLAAASSGAGTVKCFVDIED